MINFDFCSPTKIYFGKDRETEIGKILSENGFNKVLLVYGTGHVVKTGLLDKIINALKEEKIEFIQLSGIRANPEIGKVREGVALIRKNPVDAIVAIGGGSVIDAAKAISCAYYYDGDPFDLNLKIVKPTNHIPVGVILTLSASGSELSDSCVISNDEKNIKSGYNSPANRPYFAIMNPELTKSVPLKDMSAGIVDIISHSLERYFAIGSDYEFSEPIALALIKEVIEYGKILYNDPNNYECRAAIMLAGSFSHNGLTGLGKKYIFPIHALEHALSAYDYHIAHGVGLAILIPAWMNYCYSYDVKKFSNFARTVFGVRLENDIDCAKLSPYLLKSYFEEIGMPTSLSQVGIKESDIIIIANRLTDDGTRVVGQGSVKSLNKDEIIELFMSCL